VGVRVVKKVALALAITRPETPNVREVLREFPCDRALFSLLALRDDDIDRTGSGAQVVDVPARELLPPQMAPDTRLEATEGGADVSVVASLKGEVAELAHANHEVVGHVGKEHVGSARHRLNV